MRLFLTCLKALFHPSQDISLLVTVCAVEKALIGEDHDVVFNVLCTDGLAFGGTDLSAAVCWGWGGWFFGDGDGDGWRLGDLCDLWGWECEGEREEDGSCLEVELHGG